MYLVYDPATLAPSARIPTTFHTRLEALAYVQAIHDDGHIALAQRMRVAGPMPRVRG